MSTDPNTYKVSDHWDTEYQGAAEGHRTMHNIFVRMLSLYLSIATIPITLAVALSQLGAAEQAEWLLPVLRLVCLIIGIAGILFIVILIRYRFLIVECARWLNGLRHTLQQSEGECWISRTGLPTDTSSPPYHELWREMGLLVLFGAIINSFYLYLSFNLPDVSMCGELLFWALGSVVVHELIYWWMSFTRERRGTG